MFLDMAVRDSRFKNENVIIPESIIDLILNGKSKYQWFMIPYEVKEKIPMMVEAEKKRLKVGSADSNGPVFSEQLTSILAQMENTRGRLCDFLEITVNTLPEDSLGYNLLNHLNREYDFTSWANRLEK